MHVRVRRPEDLSAAVVGSGPNGLMAAIALRAAGLAVTLFERRPDLGGGVRSEPGPHPGYLRDVCSSVFPLGRASPAFEALPLRQLGLEWAKPPLPFAHPLDDGSAVAPIADPDVAEGLGADSATWRRRIDFVSDHWEHIANRFLGPLRVPPPDPRLLRFGLLAMQSNDRFCQALLRTQRARDLFSGVAAHAALPFRHPASAGAGLVLAGLAKRTGWPFAKGGAQAITDALANLACLMGVEIVPGMAITEASQLDAYDVRMLDTDPRQALVLAGTGRLTMGVIKRLYRHRYGPAVCKVDFALDEPIPWRAPVVRRAGTVHLGGDQGEIATALGRVWRGEAAPKPYVLVGQPSVADPSRAPQDGHAAWAYCHVPPGWDGYAGPAIERQIERFAPGFGDTVVARRITLGCAWPGYNPNWVDGDVLGGVQDWRWRRQPIGGWFDPYCLRDPDLYLCSAAVPPGAGVHGLCGWHAARSAIRRNCGWDFTLHELQAICRAVADAASSKAGATPQDVED